LKELVESKFITREEKRHKEHIGAAYIVAFLGAIVAIAIALFR
jgi:hypothetical protein